MDKKSLSYFTPTPLPPSWRAAWWRDVVRDHEILVIYAIGILWPVALVIWGLKVLLAID